MKTDNRIDQTTSAGNVSVTRYDSCGAMWEEVIPASLIEALEVQHFLGKKGWTIKGTAVGGRKFFLFISHNAQLKAAWNDAKQALGVSPCHENGAPLQKELLFK